MGSEVGNEGDYSSYGAVVLRVLRDRKRGVPVRRGRSRVRHVELHAARIGDVQFVLRFHANAHDLVRFASILTSISAVRGELVPSALV